MKISDSNSGAYVDSAHVTFSTYRDLERHPERGGSEQFRDKLMDILVGGVKVEGKERHYFCSPMHEKFFHAVSDLAYERGPENGVDMYTWDNKFRGKTFLKNDSILTTINPNEPDYQDCPPQPLADGLFYEGEVACLFGEPAVGKTTFAQQLAVAIAERGRRVLYVDFQDSDPRHAFRNMKVSVDEEVADRIQHVGINPLVDIHEISNPFNLILSIRTELINRATPVVIIDDISTIVPFPVSNKSIQALQLLRFMAQHWHVTFLLIAHANRSRQGSPITINNLSNSPELYYAFDSIFTLAPVRNKIGCAVQPEEKENHQPSTINPQPSTINQPATHYIKQLKSRHARIIYDENNCLLFSFHDQHFSFLKENGSERLLILNPLTQEQLEILEKAIDLQKSGKTYRQIAQELDTYLSAIFNLLHRPEAQLFSQEAPSPEESISENLCQFVAEEESAENPNSQFPSPNSPSATPMSPMSPISPINEPEESAENPNSQVPIPNSSNEGNNLSEIIEQEKEQSLKPIRDELNPPDFGITPEVMHCINNLKINLKYEKTEKQKNKETTETQSTTPL